MDESTFITREEYELMVEFLTANAEKQGAALDALGEVLATKRILTKEDLDNLKWASGHSPAASRVQAAVEKLRQLVDRKGV